MTGREHGPAADRRCGHDPVSSWDDRGAAGDCTGCTTLRTEVEKLRRCLDRIAVWPTRPAADLADRIIARIRSVP
ncbi:hypothetical protein Amsp01_041290 [Amycolatopsis sp. NBRC 101858]|uniref:hypothetical protein n=1 Tax=Amycolatopsis sp. NBRC 101858 TaxID=3032200 RepID=UPI0024A2D0F1|nr:hypothetical protein [Amycolatopsis sp. NBRC 101858]GLY38105.1 hypothetical protein Amsp01_041290 [Amycolatopsis sp. NBRC 101858]